MEREERDKKRELNRHDFELRAKEKRRAEKCCKEMRLIEVETDYD